MKRCCLCIPCCTRSDSVRYDETRYEGLYDPDPNTDAGVFRIGAADDILRLLADAHESEFSIPELVDAMVAEFVGIEQTKCTLSPSVAVKVVAARTAAFS